MKKIIITIITATSLILGGCASQPIQPTGQVIKTPIINKTTSVSLGEKMLESGFAITRPSFSLMQKVTTTNNVDILPGEFVATHTEGKKTYFKRLDAGPTVDLMFGKNYNEIVVDADGEICYYDGFGITPCSKDKANVRDKTIYTPDSFMQELIYTGKVGDKIRFTYREFTNGMARQAFNVDVEYDLSESDIIAYKGATIRIISATNTKITYIVVKHFN